MGFSIPVYFFPNFIVTKINLKIILLTQRDVNMTLQELKLKVIEFRDERNWKQFHTLKNLLIALNIECAELQELFLWEGDTIDTSKIDHSKREKINEEMGDIIIYLLYLSDYFGIDLLEAASKKIEINRKKYPIDKSFNTSKKYSDFD